MTRPLAPLATALAAAMLAPGVPLAAQQSPGTFSLPPASPTPTPAPAGPADDRGGVAIPPRAAAAPAPTASATPVIQPLPAATPRARPTAAPPARQRTLPTPALAVPDPAASGAGEAVALPSVLPTAPATRASTPPAEAAPALEPTTTEGGLTDGWLYVAGALGALLLVGGSALWLRRRRPQPRGLAPMPAAAEPEGTPDLGALDCKLEIITATRSVMMFTLAYRLTIGNRTGRAVNGLDVAVQLACARASAGQSAGAMASVARIGPYQSQAITGEVQLPLSAVQPLRQGSTPLFVPLVHVRLADSRAGGEPVSRTFVVGTPSAAGRVHPIPLDQTPGMIPGLVAQGVAVPPVFAAA